MMMKLTFYYLIGAFSSLLHVSVQGEEHNGDIQQRIIGGTFAGAGDYPWFAKAVIVPTSCMSGNTGLFKDEGQVTKLKDLKVGDTIQGFDETMEPAKCKVEAIGTFGFGYLHGNYTQDHFIFNPNTKMIQQHGVSDELTSEKRYDILTDCPLGVDEAGTKFTPIDAAFYGVKNEELSWSDYILLHKAILRVVRQAGGFYFSSSAYSNLDMLKEIAPRISSSMMTCMKNNNDCAELEDNAIIFIDEALTDEAKQKTKRAFKNLGSPSMSGSVSAVVTNGGSTKKN